MSTTLHLITGILGSGKTSVLRHLLDGPLVDARVAVVVGEFADEGFDGDLLRGGAAVVKEVSGSVVRVGASPYVEAVRSFLWEGEITDLFIETSGVADIGQIGAALLGDKLVMREASLGRSITVLDAGAFRSHDTHFHDQLWAQIEAADVVVVNKTDKVSEEGLDGIRSRILERQPGARVLFCYMGQVRRREVFDPVPEGFRSALLDVAGREDTGPAEFESFVYESDLICFDRVAFGHLLLNLPGQRLELLGIDSGREPAPREVTDVLLAPGNRADLRAVFDAALADMEAAGAQEGAEGGACGKRWWVLHYGCL